MKRISCLLLTLVMVLPMCACGKTESVPTESIPTETPAVEVRPQETVHSETVEAFENDTETVQIEELPEETNLFTEGIYVINYQEGSSYSWKSTQMPKCTTCKICVDVIDPETGEFCQYKTFSTLDTKSATIFIDNTNSVNGKCSFSPDLSKVAASVKMEDGAEHMGWVDENGNFTDVSAKITEEGDFNPLTKHQRPQFHSDGYLYFRDNSNGSIFKRVPIDNLSPEAVEDMGYETQIGIPAIYFNSPGGVQCYYYEGNSKYPAFSRFFGDWVSENECVGKYPEKQMIYRFTLDGDAYQPAAKEELIPNIDGRHNYSPRVSPNKQQVAFLSYLEHSAEPTLSLYVVPIEGGSPIKIDTDCPFGVNSSETSLLYWR